MLRLTRFKKENKELFTYILFESANENEYVKQVKKEISEEIEKIDTLTPYLYKKIQKNSTKTEQTWEVNRSNGKRLRVINKQDIWGMTFLGYIELQGKNYYSSKYKIAE